jgi:exonuclease VII small subunit
MSQRLDELVSELEATAARLRAGELEGEEAAELVERCAQLAVQLGTELDAESRAASDDSSGAGDRGQERLL